MNLPADPTQSLLSQAMAFHNAGQLPQAEQFYRQILARDPRQADALNWLGVLMQQRGDVTSAMQLLSQAVAINPNNADYHSNLGGVFQLAGKFADAELAYRRAIALRPNVALYWSNLSLALKHQKKIPDAIAAAEKSVALDPNWTVGHIGLGDRLCEVDQYDEALQSYQRALILEPRQSTIHIAIGTTLVLLRRFDEAIASYDRAIALDDSPYAHWNRGLAKLLNGNLADGFAEYEWRTRCRHFASPRIVTNHPQWDGSDIRGKTVLVFTEQGLGDAIQFARYLPLLAERGANVIVECGPELKTLLSRVPGVKQVIARNEPRPPFDLYVLMLSLPHLVGTMLETIPPPAAIASATFEKSVQRKIGLAWAGSATHVGDRSRSIKLAQLAPLADIKNVQWFSLQKGPASAEAKSPPTGMNLIDRTDELRDFSATADLIAGLDLVITVDTAVAHLAATMGKPVWLLLQYVPDWRWMLDREDSPWYPSMRLFRQQKLGDWQPVIERIMSELLRLI